MRLVSIVVAVMLAGVSDVVRAQEDPIRFEMRRIYHDFDVVYQRARRAHGVALDLNPGYEACISRSAEIARCRRTIESLDDRLQMRIHDAQMLAESRRQTEILREQATREEEINSNTNITIYDDDNPYRHHRRDRWRERPPYVRPDPYAVPTYRPPPDFTPKNRFQAGDGFR